MSIPAITSNILSKTCAFKFIIWGIDAILLPWDKTTALITVGANLRISSSNNRDEIQRYFIRAIEQSIKEVVTGCKTSQDVVTILGSTLDETAIKKIAFLYTDISYAFKITGQMLEEFKGDRTDCYYYVGSEYLICAVNTNGCSQCTQFEPLGKV